MKDTLEGFEQIVDVRPAYNKKHEDPKKNYGIGSCTICFILKGPEGAVQFLISTDWFLPADQRASRDWQHNFDVRFDKIKPNGWDVGYHSPKPMYKDHSSRDDCDILDGTCYYDGSGLRADDWIPEFLAGGTDWLWPKLKDYYEEIFLQLPKDII